MYKGKKFLAIIPARGGSKGIPRKNIKVINNKHLIFYTIQAAQKSKLIDRLITSSDDQEIIDIAEKYGCECPFIRPSNLASDTASGIAPILHAIEKIPDFDYIVLLQPTSPLRSVEDIDGCIKACLDAEEKNSAVTITEAEKSPYWMYFQSKDKAITPIFGEAEKATRRQDLPQAYYLNGAVYVCSIKRIKKDLALINKTTIGYRMPKSRSLDIDTFEDLNLFEKALEKE